MKLALIGMPTSGKSTIAKLLVANSDYHLIDLDALLEKRFHMSLQDFINTEGEAEFLKQENLLMLSINYPENCIISTGGSVIYASEAMTEMQNDGIHFVYLKVPISILKKRLSTQRDTRGVIMNGLSTWEELLEDRNHLYHYYANTVINTGGKTAQQIYQEILNKVLI